jgi:hypothetical protein
VNDGTVIQRYEIDILTAPLCPYPSFDKNFLAGFLTPENLPDFFPDHTYLLLARLRTGYKSTFYREITDNRQLIADCGIEL